MTARFNLVLPFLVAIMVVLTVLWGGRQRSLTVVQSSLPSDSGAPPAVKTVKPGRSGMQAHVDPVCSMEVGTNIETQYRGTSRFFCTERCRETFNADPSKYLGNGCLVCRREGEFTAVDDRAGYKAVWQEKTYYFCSAAHRDAFREDAVGYFMHSMWGLPGWLYYLSVAGILVLSFLILERDSFGRRKAKRPGSVGRAKTEGPAVGPDRARIDLLQQPLIRRLVVSSRLRFVLRGVLVLVFLLIITAGLFGNQLPTKNIAPLLTWTVWWGGLIWLVAYFGKFWCYACPWDAIAEWSEKKKLWAKRGQGLGLGIKWPRFMRNIWPATILFVGLTWLELGFGVTMKPRVTAWLGLFILGLAFISAFIFDRKSFCRYGCLVGRVSGLYALFAPIEVRARNPEVCRSCTSHSCVKGNDRGDGCPTFQFPGKMEQNTYCIMCTECLKTCESDNMTVQLRPWGEDLNRLRKPRSDEAYLALVMLSLTGFHGLTMTGAWQKAKVWIETSLGMSETLSFSMGMLVIMLAPVVLYGLLVGVSRWLAGAKTVGYRTYFVSYAYALLPIALFYHLAHNSEHLFMEGQKIIALTSDPFGREWDLFGTAGWSLQPIVNLPTLWVLQVVFVAIGHVFSLWAAKRAAVSLFPDSRTALRSQIPMLLAMILFSLMSLWLLKQPMEMRTSAM